MGRPQKRWHEALFNRRMLICVFTGFSSGLPLWLLINLLPAWLRSEQVDLASIGLFALMQLPFTWKFLWSPLLDRYALPMLGRRRGWMLVTQIALLISIPLFGLLEPKLDLWTIAGLAAPLRAGHDVGVMSEAGCPGIADPGAKLVLYAHRHAIH